MCALRTMKLRNPDTVRLALVLVSLLTGAACAHEKVRSTTDYIVVGAGTAGCVLAARLCEALPNATIALFERAPPRGKEAEFLVRSPRNAFAAWESPLVAEIFPSSSNPGLNGRSVPIVTGNTLGGSSAINGMQWTIPSAGTVESWGIRRLSTRSAKKFYRRAFRKVGFAVQKVPLRQRYTRDLISAARSAGVRENSRPFDGGVDNSIWETRDAVDAKGRRVDAYAAYVAPVLNGKCRHNLNLIQGATVTRLVFDGISKKPRIVGVRYVDTDGGKRGKERVLYARKEVILSAGPYGSPKLLQLSGIGPTKLLTRVGINVKVELAVGSRTQIRPLSAVAWSYFTKPLEPSNNEALLESPQVRADWEAGRGGVFGTAIGAVNGRFKRDAYIAAGFVFPKGAGLGAPLTSAGCLGNPKSFGNLRISEADPFAPLDVNLNLLGKSKDRKRMLACMKLLNKVYASFPPDFGMRNQTPVGPELNEDYVKQATISGHHFVGGCSVGSVVTRNLKVQGVRGLRVVDASVLRSLPESAGPQASVYMLAEFAANKFVRKAERHDRKKHTQRRNSHRVA